MNVEYSKTLLTSENYIKSVSNISDNLHGKFILPCIHESQDMDLQETIGSQLYHKLQELVYSDKIIDEDNEKYKYLIDVYIQAYLTYLTISKLAYITSFKFSNFGVGHTTDENEIAADIDDVDTISDYYLNKADFYKMRLQGYLAEHYNDYPELGKNKSMEDLHTNLYSAATCGLWLGGARGDGCYPHNYKDYLMAKYRLY